MQSGAKLSEFCVLFGYLSQQDGPCLVLLPLCSGKKKLMFFGLNNRIWPVINLLELTLINCVCINSTLRLYLFLNMKANTFHQLNCTYFFPQQNIPFLLLKRKWHFPERTMTCWYSLLHQEQHLQLQFCWPVKDKINLNLSYSHTITCGQATLFTLYLGLEQGTSHQHLKLVAI